MFFFLLYCVFVRRDSELKPYPKSRIARWTVAPIPSIARGVAQDQNQNQDPTPQGPINLTNARLQRIGTDAWLHLLSFLAWAVDWLVRPLRVNSFILAPAWIACGAHFVPKSFRGTRRNAVRQRSSQGRHTCNTTLKASRSTSSPTGPSVMTQQQMRLHPQKTNDRARARPTMSITQQRIVIGPGLSARRDHFALALKSPPKRRIHPHFAQRRATTGRADNVRHGSIDHVLVEHLDHCFLWK